MTFESQNACNAPLKGSINNSRCSWVQVLTKGLEAQGISNVSDDRCNLEH